MTTSFKVIKGKFPFEIEEQLNNLKEDYHTLKVHCMTFDHNTSQDTLIVELGGEIHPMTYYNPANNQFYKLNT